MGYNPAAARRKVNLNINSDLVERCKAGIGNFSAYVESLLAADLEQREQRAAADKAANEQAVDAFAALYNSEGSLSEEFQGF
jgi:post-segregation antitoxin (ccd killing protein)